MRDDERDDELVRRIADGDWAAGDDAAAHRRPSVAQIVELVRRRRRRRRVAAVGGVGLAAAGVVVVVALLPGAAETGTVPPAAPSRTPTAPTTDTPVSPEGMCDNKSVLISLGAYEGGGGLRQPVEVANIGNSACSVAVPSLSLMPEDGPSVPVRGPAVREVLLKPGTALSLMVFTATMCGNDRDLVLVESIRAEMPDGWTYDMNSAHLVSGCDRPAPRVTNVSVHPVQDR
jgi:hypothetical protein